MLPASLDTTLAEKQTDKENLDGILFYDKFIFHSKVNRSSSVWYLSRSTSTVACWLLLAISHSSFPTFPSSHFIHSGAFILQPEPGASVSIVPQHYSYHIEQKCPRGDHLLIP